MSKKLKLLAVFLAAVMMLLSLPMSVFAEYPDDTPQVESIVCENVTCIENADGYYGGVHFYYNYGRPDFTVVLKDGTVLYSEYGRVEYNGDYYYISCQDDQYEEPWGVGVHTVTASLWGYETSFEVEVIENPVVGVSIEPIKCIFGSDGDTATWYDPDTETYEEYYRYNYTPRHFTVTLNDGTELTGQYGWLYYDNRSYYLDTNDTQSPDNQWGIGVYTVEAEIMGFKTTFDVEIIESPVVSLEFEPVRIIEGTNGYLRSEYDWETDTETEYFYYNIDSVSPKWTVVMSDGSVIEDYGSLEYNNEWHSFNFTTNQSSSSPWGIGVHTVEAEVLGYKTSFDVEIIESPIVSLEFKPVQIIEGTNGYLRSEYDYETDTETEYFYYNIDSVSPKWTAVMSDGSVIEDYGSLKYNNEWHSFNFTTDQSSSSPWGIGVHTVEAEVLGYKTAFDVEIISSPIVSLEFEPVQIIEGTNGYLTQDYDWETNTYKEYYHYRIYPEWKAVLTDGKVIEGRGSDFVEYNGKWHSLSLNINQSASNPWGIGVHAVEASILGHTTSFDVEIIPSPYVSIEVVLTEELRENTSCRKLGDGSVIYNHPRFFYKVAKNDGSSIAGYCTGYSSGELIVSDNQANEPWTVGGNNIMTVEYLGLKTEVNVVIRSTSPFDCIEQNGGLYITDCRVYNDTIEIPSQIDGKTVKGILSLGKAVEKVRHIVIPDTVETMGADVFNYKYGVNGNAGSLETLTIGSGVKYLDANMFKQCYVLESITVSEGNANYCDIDGIVYNKTEDTLVVYPIGKGNDYKVPASVKDFDIISGMSCYRYVNVTLSDDSAEYKTVDGVTYNADMTKIIKCNPDKSGDYVMPSSVTDIMPEAFKGCSRLTGVKFSNKVSRIVYRSFADCSILVSVTLPDSLVSISKGAFEGCKNLNNVVLPNSLETIGGAAFRNCFAMSSVTFGTGLKTIEAEAFYDCPIDSIVLHAGIEKIGDYAFHGAAIKTVALPKGDIELGERIFTNCANLESFDLGDSTVIPTRTFENCGFKQLNIPRGIETIGERAFYYCDQIESVNISDTVKEIKSFAFYCCESLLEIVLPDNVVTIGEYVFSGCLSLKSFTFGKSITKIPAGTFDECGFETLVIPGRYTEIGDGAFGYCRKLTSITIENKDTVLGIGAFRSCALTEINLPVGFTSVGAGAFANNEIEELHLPDSVTKIAYRAFSGCTNLGEIELPENLVSLGAYSFHGTKWYEENVDDIKYLSNALYIIKGDYDCFEVKDGTTVIADLAFYFGQINSVVLPATLKGIGAGSFGSCRLTEINIPASVEYIGEFAFVGCDKLCAVNVDPANEYYKSIDGVLFTKDGSELIWCPKRESANYIVPEGVKVIKTGAFAFSGVENITVPDPETVLEDRAVGYAGGVVSMWRSNVVYWTDYKPTYVNINCRDGSAAMAYAEDNLVKITVISGEISSCDHDTVLTNRIEPTCTEAGSITEVCALCGTVVSTTELAATGHTDGEAVIVSPTCTKDGSKTISCSVCGETVSVESIPAAGHDEELRVVLPTPIAQGYTEHKCKVCGYIYKDTYTDFEGEDPVITVENAVVKPGETVSVTVYAKNFTDITKLCISNVDYDESKLSLIGAEWIIDAAVKQWGDDEDGSLGYVEFGEDTAVDGAVLRLYFAATDGIEDCDTLITVSGSYSCRDGNDTVIDSPFAESGGTVTVRNADTGDMNTDGYTDSDDVIYMLYYFLDPASYPLYQPADFNGDGCVDSDDAIYLLYNILLPERFPLLG